MAKKPSKDQKIRALKLEIKNLRTIISMMPGNVYWKDTKGKYLGCNANLAEILNLNSPEDIIGKTDQALLGSEMGAKAQFIDPQVIATNKEYSIEETGIDLEGFSATYLTRKTPLLNQRGNVKGILGVSFDITERKFIEEKLKIAKQKAVAANKAKTKFLAMISHELRTPLSGILGFAELVKKPNLNKKLKNQYLSHIEESSHYLLSLINSLLDYSKLDMKKLTLNLLPIDLRLLTKSIFDIYSLSAIKKNIKFLYHFDENLPEFILSDQQVLHQILINLVGNAIKFTSSGFVKLSVKCLAEQSDLVKILFEIEDTGIGIPENEQKFIFKQFYQLGNAYTKKLCLSGTGLGLAIVKKLTQLIGGKISLTSKVSHGSTFTVTSKFKSLVKNNMPWVKYAASIKILVIDDAPKAKLRNALQYSLHDFISTKEAFNMLSAAQQTTNDYDIIILNTTLNDELVSHLLDYANQCKIPPFIINLQATHKYKFVNGFWRFGKSLKQLTYLQFQIELTQAWEKRCSLTRQPSIQMQTKTNPKVLLVEDNALIQIIHKDMLEELGCRVDLTESAVDAIKKFNQSYDILFVDIGLPDIAGFDLIEKIRQHKHGKGVPIIVLTGYSGEDEKLRCLRVGANEVSVKPITKDTFKKILDKLKSNF